MILVVVAMHTVPADREYVAQSVEITSYPADSAVRPQIRGVCLGHSYHRAVEHVRQVDQPDLGQLAAGEVEETRIGHAPELIVLGTEVFQAEPDGGRVGDQARTPVVENLQPTHLDIGLLNINPIVRWHAIGGAGPAGLRAHAFHQHAGRHEIAVRQCACDYRDV